MPRMEDDVVRNDDKQKMQNTETRVQVAAYTCSSLTALVRLCLIDT